MSDPRNEWRLSDIENKLRNKADKHELSETQEEIRRLKPSN